MVRLWVSQKAAAKPRRVSLDAHGLGSAFLEQQGAPLGFQLWPALPWGFGRGRVGSELVASSREQRRDTSELAAVHCGGVAAGTIGAAARERLLAGSGDQLQVPLNLVCQVRRIRGAWGKPRWWAPLGALAVLFSGRRSYLPPPSPAAGPDVFLRPSWLSRRNSLAESSPVGRRARGTHPFPPPWCPPPAAALVTPPHSPAKLVTPSAPGPLPSLPAVQRFTHLS